MAKGLPYFKFKTSEWLTGDICFESFDVQGLFINICALYWQKEGKLTISDIEHRYKKPTGLSSLLGRYIFETEGKISIQFLDEQFEERGQKSIINKQNGAKGGRPKNEEYKGEKPTRLISQTETKPNAKRKKGNKEEEKEKEEDILNTTIVVLEQNEILPQNHENENSEFTKFNKWLKENCPNVCKIKIQISEKEFETLKTKFAGKKIADTLLQMQNYKGVENKYTSVYLTLNNWIKNDKSTSIIERNNQVAREVAAKIVGNSDF